MDKLERLALLFSLAPVMKGFIAMSISGAVFPLCGVMVLRLNLVPMRYMLMHGVILGGAIAMALDVPLLPVTITVNLILVFMMLMMTNDGTGRNFGGTSAATMILSMALASLIMHVADVPAKDTLDLLWGSPFALSLLDIISLSILALVLLLYVTLNFRNIKNLFFIGLQNYSFFGYKRSFFCFYYPKKRRRTCFCCPASLARRFGIIR